MDRKIILTVLAAVVLGFVGVLLLIPSRVDDDVVRLPWDVGVDESGRTNVFGFAIGETTLAEVRGAFGESGKLELFHQLGADDEYAAEAYFDRMYLSGLRADFVFTLEVDEGTLEAMYERGLRIRQLPSGGKRVQLAPEDQAQLADAPIRTITYLPWKSLDPVVIERRFGKPARQIAEDGGVIHWLYPDVGMDLARDPSGGVVIQYVDRESVDDMFSPLGTAVQTP